MTAMSYAEHVQRAIDYIEAHLSEELDLSGLADESYVSVAQLYRMFYALTGHPVKDYIRRRRISVAADRLRHSRSSVEALAWDSGFESSHSFAKAFKKIVGLTPAAYRKADIYFSFEPIRLREKVDYPEDKENAERFPDVKVIRLLPSRAFVYLHVSEEEEGMENEAFRAVFGELTARRSSKDAKVRIFGRNVDLPDEDGRPRYGYKVMIVHEGETGLAGSLAEEPFEGGLYAARKVPAMPAQTVRDGWNRLVSEWLPASAFEIDTHPYVEEFVAYNGKVTRMNLYLPVRKKERPEPIEVVDLPEREALFCRGYGDEAQMAAERRLIEWYGREPEAARQAGEGRYYMSYAYGAKDFEETWWENGILTAEPSDAPSEGLHRKRLGSGAHACCATKAYGSMAGVLGRMHRWIAANGRYRLDDERQWFAEYFVLPGANPETEAVVKVYVPIVPKGENST